MMQDIPLFFAKHEDYEEKVAKNEVTALFVTPAHMLNFLI